MVAELFEKIEKVSPGLTAVATAQLCLLLFQQHGEGWRELTGDQLRASCQRLRCQLEQTADQYHAVTNELRAMAKSDPAKFGKEQVWTMLRAIKIQDQLLKLHIGGELMNV